MCRGGLGVALCLGILLSGVAVASDCDPDEGLYQRLLRHEGQRNCAYLDHLGNPTIGVGHLLKRPVPPNLCWDPEHIRDVFHSDVHRAMESAVRIVPGWHRIPTVRREVFIELDFQIGPHRLHGFRLMLAAVKAGDWAAAGRELLRSRLAEQTPARTRELACLLRGASGG